MSRGRLRMRARRVQTPASYPGRVQNPREQPVRTAGLPRGRLGSTPTVPGPRVSKILGLDMDILKPLLSDLKHNRIFAKFS